MRKGFTLVELLIVIAVLGSLGAMMSYSSSGAVDTVEDTTDTRTIAEVLGAYLGKKADALTANGAAKNMG
ncbi:MAG: type II secretion system protein [Synergistaceae bacterium]|nr:type II secretion system protein [Synergistaceae bacterium]